MRRAHEVRRKAAIAFFTGVLAFAIIYWLAWWARPDSIAVSGSANVRPLQAIRDIVWTDAQPEPGTFDAATVEEINGRAAPLLAAWRALPAEEQKLARIEADLEQQLDRVRADAGPKVDARIREYEALQLRELDAKRAAIETEIATLERAAAAAADDQAASQLRIQAIDRSVDLARHKVVVAKKRAEVAAFIADNFGSFMPDEDRKRIETLRAAADRNFEGQMQLADRRTRIRVQLDNLLQTETRRVLNRLAFVDFVYFSFGVATTVTFGDITPNSTLVRGLVALQLLFSIVTVGFFVNSLAPEE